MWVDGRVPCRRIEHAHFLLTYDAEETVGALIEIWDPSIAPITPKTWMDN